MRKFILFLFFLTLDIRFGYAIIVHTVSKTVDFQVENAPVSFAIESPTDGIYFHATDNINLTLVITTDYNWTHYLLTCENHDVIIGSFDNATMTTNPLIFIAPWPAGDYNITCWIYVVGNDTMMSNTDSVFFSVYDQSITIGSPTAIPDTYTNADNLTMAATVAPNYYPYDTIKISCYMDEILVLNNLLCTGTSCSSPLGYLTSGWHTLKCSALLEGSIVPASVWTANETVTFNVRDADVTMAIVYPTVGEYIYENTIVTIHTTVNTTYPWSSIVMTCYFDDYLLVSNFPCVAADCYYNFTSNNISAHDIMCFATVIGIESISSVNETVHMYFFNVSFAITAPLNANFTNVQTIPLTAIITTIYPLDFAAITCYFDGVAGAFNHSCTIESPGATCDYTFPHALTGAHIIECRGYVLGIDNNDYWTANDTISFYVDWTSVSFWLLFPTSSQQFLPGESILTSAEFDTLYPHTSASWSCNINGTVLFENESCTIGTPTTCDYSFNESNIGEYLIECWGYVVGEEQTITDNTDSSTFGVYNATITIGRPEYWRWIEYGNDVIVTATIGTLYPYDYIVMTCIDNGTTISTNSSCVDLVCNITIDTPSIGVHELNCYAIVVALEEIQAGPVTVLYTIFQTVFTIDTPIEGQIITDAEHINLTVSVLTEFSIISMTWTCWRDGDSTSMFTNMSCPTPPICQELLEPVVDGLHNYTCYAHIYGGYSQDFLTLTDSVTISVMNTPVTINITAPSNGSYFLVGENVPITIELTTVYAWNYYYLTCYVDGILEFRNQTCTSVSCNNTVAAPILGIRTITCSATVVGLDELYTPDTTTTVIILPLLSACNLLLETYRNTCIADSIYVLTYVNFNFVYYCLENGPVLPISLSCPTGMIADIFCLQTSLSLNISNFIHCCLPNCSIETIAVEYAPPQPLPSKIALIIIFSVVFVFSLIMISVVTIFIVGNFNSGGNLDWRTNPGEAKTRKLKSNSSRTKKPNLSRYVKYE
jgi:hypothetical protein